MEGLLELNLVSTGIKTFAMLFVVLALLMTVLYFLKRFSIQGKETKGDVRIKALSSLSLSTKERIQVVEIAGEKYVLGISPAGMTLITKIDDNSENNFERSLIKNADHPSGISSKRQDHHHSGSDVNGPDPSKKVNS